MWCMPKIAWNANVQNHVMHGTTMFPIVWTNLNPTVLIPDKELCKTSRRIELPANRQNRHQLSKITEYAVVWENLKYDRRTQITGKRATNIIIHTLLPPMYRVPEPPGPLDCVAALTLVLNGAAVGSRRPVEWNCTAVPPRIDLELDSSVDAPRMLAAHMPSAILFKLFVLFSFFFLRVLMQQKS